MFGWLRKWLRRRNDKLTVEEFARLLRSGQVAELLIVHQGLSQAEIGGILASIESLADVILEHKYSMLITPGEGRTGVKVVPSKEFSTKQEPSA